MARDSSNVLFVGRDSVFIWSDLSQQGPTAYVDTDDAFHEYLIEVRHHSEVLVYQDDVLILTGAITTSPLYPDSPYFWWGDGNDASSGVSEWTFMRHNAAATPCGNVTAVPSDPKVDPSPNGGIAMAAPYPNPARGGLSLVIQADRAAEGPAVLRIFDSAGRLLRTRAVGPLAAGITTVRWDGRDEDGGLVSAGIYFFRLESEGKAIASSRAVVIK